MSIVVVTKIPSGVSRGTPTVCTHRKAAVLGALWQVRRTPPGSESGAYLHRGNSGTWESHRSPCLQTRTGGPGDHRPWRGRRASTRPRAQQGQHERAEASKVSGSERRAKQPETGRMAVFAEHSTEEGGELSPTGPTGGKATPGITFCWTERREIL
jgi:hypothetical protein